MVNLKKFENKILIFIFIFAILSLSIVPVLARENNSVTIHLSDFRKGETISNRKLKLWKISDEFIKGNLNEKLRDLENTSESDLDKKYENRITDPSNSDGIINISNLSDGTYYVREVLNGSENSHIYSFFIFLPLSDIDSKDIFPKSTGDNPPDTPPDTPPGTPPGSPPEVELIKVSEGRSKLKDAVFEIYENSPDGIKKVPIKDNNYDVNGGLDELFATDENGEIHIKNLPAGNYIFREIKAPDGYKILERDTYFEFNGRDKKVLRVTNKKEDHKDGYRFIKIDGETKMPLKGATFKVTRKVDDRYLAVKRGQEEYTVVSDDSGNFSVDELEYGKYYLWEIKATEGYKLLNGYVEFDVEKDSSFNKIEIENERDKAYISPDSPPNSKTPGEIPKTGDITLIVLTISGIVLSLVGLSLIKKDTSK